MRIYIYAYITIYICMDANVDADVGIYI